MKTQFSVVKKNDEEVYLISNSDDKEVFVLKNKAAIQLANSLYTSATTKLK